MQLEFLFGTEEERKKVPKPVPPPLQNSTFHNITVEQVLNNDKQGRRRLQATQNVLSNPGIITFDQQGSNKYEYYAYRYTS